MKPRNAKITSQALREFAIFVYNNGGLVRKLSNEGIMRPYKKYRDTNNEVLTFARYVQMQCDLGEEAMLTVRKNVSQHSDVFAINVVKMDRVNVTDVIRKDRLALDSFTKMEEEIFWPPQTSMDVYENLDRNWKEFSRTRWSNYLRN
eukprot:GILI01031760.1.p1 GENE.GILI01031760.1~~GILI01031760.1.p1  ORF type:complete len:172 (+),score=21.14 GILI01031760.1:78-518(+)